MVYISPQLIYIVPKEMGCLKGFPQPQKALLRSNPRPDRGRAVRLSCSKLIGITSPAEILDHQTSVCITSKITSLLDLHRGREMDCQENDFLKFTFNGLNCEWLMRLR